MRFDAFDTDNMLKDSLGGLGHSSIFMRFLGGGGSESVSRFTRGQSNIFKKIMRDMALPEIGEPGPSYSGRRVAPFAPLQEQAFKFAGGLPQTVQAEAFQPADSAQIERQFQPTAQFARRGFQQETIPAIMAALGAQGMARSSGAADILGRQGRNLELGLADQLGRQQFGAQQAALSRQAQVPALSSQLSSQLANLGVMQRGLKQEQIGAGREQFMEQQPIYNPSLGLATSLLDVQPFAISQKAPGFGQQLATSFLPTAAAPLLFGTAGAGGAAGTAGLLGTGGLGASMSSLGAGLGTSMSGLGAGLGGAAASLAALI